MEKGLMQKARAGRQKALISLRFSRDFCGELSITRRFPELEPNDVVALFDTTQRHFSYNSMKPELQSV